MLRLPLLLERLVAVLTFPPLTVNEPVDPRTLAETVAV